MHPAAGASLRINFGLEAQAELVIKYALVNGHEMTRSEQAFA
jgi:hypothetical protein